MAESALAVEVREASGKGVARKLRAAGRIPGVCYGRNAPSLSVTLDPHALERLLATSEAGLNTLIDLEVDGGGAFDGRKVLIRELQRDPVDGALLHADLFAVDLEQTVHVAVPLHVTGTPEGVKMGGILDQSLRELEFECLPQAIPREISADVSALAIGQSLHVRDIALPEGVTLLSDPDLSVVSVVAPAVAAEVMPAEEEEAAPAEAVEGEAPVEEAAPEAEKAGESGGE